MERITAPKPTLTIAICGKYTELHDAYMSVAEALRHAGAVPRRRCGIRWVNTESWSRRALSELAEGRGWHRGAGRLRRPGRARAR